jgi:hypothetical protein
VGMLWMNVPETLAALESFPIRDANLEAPSEKRPKEWLKEGLWERGCTGSNKPPWGEAMARRLLLVWVCRPKEPTKRLLNQIKLPY